MGLKELEGLKKQREENGEKGRPKCHGGGTIRTLKISEKKNRDPPLRGKHPFL